VLGFRIGVSVGLLLASGLADALAQGIYTCIDGKGRRITSDRPITECLDREQRELNASGTVKRTVKPSMTADEAAAEEERNRKAQEERIRLADEKKRERVLLARYPDRLTHDRERAQALVNVDTVIAAAQKRLGELDVTRRKLAQEAEFYRADPSKTPAKLKREMEQVEQEAAAQKRFLDNQDQEKKRVNARFDEELAKLHTLWAEKKAASAGAAAAAAKPQTDRR
jgi:hypothetical protein